jgi:hypothetical protein
VNVAKWSYLESWNQVDGGAYTGSVEINGVTYNHSVYFLAAYGDNDNVGFNLARKCYSLKAVVGVDDSDTSGSSAEFSIETDGTTVFDASLKLGADRPVVLNVRHVLRLELDAYIDAGGNDFDYGNARVLCS